jgi:hypothetical protein
VLDFAVGQILRDDTALGALPAVLGRLVSTFGLRAAVAFQPAAAAAGQPGERPTVLAMSPRGSVDEALLARIGTLTANSPGSARTLRPPSGDAHNDMNVTSMLLGRHGCEIHVVGRGRR